jgi:ankyrin repeat protein
MSIYAYAPAPVFSNPLLRHTIGPTPAPDAPLAVKQVFMQSLTRDPRLESHLPVLEDDINVFLDWTRPINANGEFGSWSQADITRFLRDYIACNLYRGKEPDAQAILKLADQPSRSGESLFLCGLRNGNFTVVNLVLNAYCSLGHRGLSGLTEEQFLHCLSFVPQIHFNKEAVLRFFVLYLKVCGQRAAQATCPIFGANVWKSLLDRAIHKNDLESVIELLHIGPLHRGPHHLHLAVERAGPAVVEAVIGACLGQGYSLNAIDQFGQTALFIAVAHRDYEITELLLANGADVNLMPAHAIAKDLLAVALLGYDGRTVELLLPKFGGDIAPYLTWHPKGGLDDSYIQESLDQCKIAYIETIIAHEMVDLKQYYCFNFIDQPFPNWKKAKLVRILVSNGASLHHSFRHFESVLHYAIEQRDSMWLLRALIVGGLSFNNIFSGERPLEIAISKQNSAAYELLYAAGHRARPPSKWRPR